MSSAAGPQTKGANSAAAAGGPSARHNSNNRGQPNRRGGGGQQYSNRNVTGDSESSDRRIDRPSQPNSKPNANHQDEVRVPFPMIVDAAYQSSASSVASGAAGDLSATTNAHNGGGAQPPQSIPPPQSGPGVPVQQQIAVQTSDGPNPKLNLPSGSTILQENENNFHVFAAQQQQQQQGPPLQHPPHAGQPHPHMGPPPQQQHFHHPQQQHQQNRHHMAPHHVPQQQQHVYPIPGPHGMVMPNALPLYNPMVYTPTTLPAGVHLGMPFQQQQQLVMQPPPQHGPEQMLGGAPPNGDVQHWQQHRQPQQGTHYVGQPGAPAQNPAGGYPPQGAAPHAFGQPGVMPGQLGGPQAYLGPQYPTAPAGPAAGVGGQPLFPNPPPNFGQPPPVTPQQHAGGPGAGGPPNYGVPYPPQYQQTPVTVQTQPQSQPPAQRPGLPHREKKILTFTNPDTKEAVVISKPTDSATAGPSTSSSTAPVPPSPSGSSVHNEQPQQQQQQQQPTQPAAPADVPATPSQPVQAPKVDIRAQMLNQLKQQQQQQQQQSSSSSSTAAPAGEEALAALTATAQQLAQLTIGDAKPAAETTPLPPSTQTAPPGLPALQAVESTDVPAPVAAPPPPPPQPLLGTSRSTGALAAAGGSSGSLLPPTIVEETEPGQAAAEAAAVAKRQADLLSRLADIEKAESDQHKNLVYSAAFFRALGQVEEELKRTPCALTFEHRKALGIDISLVPPADNSKRGTGQGQNWNPNWMATAGPVGGLHHSGSQGGNRKPANYAGRFSDGPRQARMIGPPRDAKKAPVPARTSIDRPAREVVKLRSSENAWKKGTDVDELEKKLKTVRSLMNKITPNTSDSLIKQFLDFNVSTDEELTSQVTVVIFDKAVDEPKFARLYATLCKSQVEEDLKSNSGGTHSPFRNSIMRHLQKTFEKKDDESLEALRKRISEEPDAQKKRELEAEEQELYQRLRRIKFGNINFIGQLYLLHQLPSRIIGHCVQELFKLASVKGSDSCDDEAVSCVVKLLDAVGGAIHQNPGDLGPDWMRSHLSVLESIQSKVTPRVRVMIMNLLDLASGNWHRKATQEQGPKKLEEIHEQLEKEEQARKAAEIANRAVHPTGIASRQSLGKKALPVARGSQGSGGSGGGQQNVSAEEKRRMAAKASNTTGSVTPAASRGTLSQATANTNQLNKSRNWASGAGGGGPSANSTLADQPSHQTAGTGPSGGGRKPSADERRGPIMAARSLGGGGKGQQQGGWSATGGGSAGGSGASSAVQSGTVTPRSASQQSLANQAAQNAQPDQPAAASGSVAGAQDEQIAGEQTSEPIETDVPIDLSALEAAGQTLLSDIGDYFANPSDEQELLACFDDLVRKKDLQLSHLIAGLVIKANTKLDISKRAGEVLCLLVEHRGQEPVLRGIELAVSLAVENDLLEELPRFWPHLAVLVVAIILGGPIPKSTARRSSEEAEPKADAPKRIQLQDLIPVFAAVADQEEGHQCRLVIEVLKRLAEQLSEQLPIDELHGALELSWTEVSEQLKSSVKDASDLVDGLLAKTAVKLTDGTETTLSKLLLSSTAGS